MPLDAVSARLRYSLVVRSKATFVALILVGFALVGTGVATYDVPKETVQEQRHHLTVGSSLGTSAEVTEGGRLYPRGTELENLPVYLTSVSSNLSVSLETTVDAPSEATVEQRLLLVHRLSHSGEVFWNRSEVIGTSGESVAEGVVKTEGEVDINETKGEVRRLRSEVGNGAKLSSFIVSETEYETDRYSGELRGESSLSLSEASYSVERNSTTERRSTPVTKEVVDESRVVTLVGANVPLVSAVLVGIGSLATVFGVLSLVYVHFAAPTETLRHEVERSRYSDWVSEGEIPWERVDREVEIDSLGGLVDVGIDSSKRTVYDVEKDTYAVLDGGTVYYHRRSRHEDDEGDDGGDDG